jgi:hypothetical protein
MEDITLVDMTVSEFFEYLELKSLPISQYSVAGVESLMEMDDAPAIHASLV